MGNFNSVVARENLETRIYNCFTDLSDTMVNIKGWKTLLTVEINECERLRLECINCIKEAKQTFDSRTNLASISDEHLNKLIANLYSLSLDASMSKQRDTCVKLCRRISRYIEKYSALPTKSQRGSSSNNSYAVTSVTREPTGNFFSSNSSVTCDPVVEL